MLTSRTLGFAALNALALLHMPVQFASAEANPKLPFANIPGVSIQYYDVAGSNPKAIRRSINAARPTDPNDGERVDGLSKWDFRWGWHQDGHGNCKATPEDITFSATVTMPRLSDATVAPQLRQKFDLYQLSLLAHEEGHIRTAWDHRGEIVKAINAADCITANSAAQEALRAIAARDIAYDKATKHGATTVLPLG
jgi:predicted secreted Zn-dependent protease